MEKAELQLTKKSIANEGIEIKINQSDVIDMIVDEQVIELTNAGNDLINEGRGLSDSIKKEWVDYLDKLEKSMQVPKRLKVIGHYTIKNYHCSSKTKTLLLMKKSTDSKGSIRYFIEHSKGWTTGESGTIIIKYTSVVSDVFLTGEGNPVPFTFTHSKALIDHVDDYNKRVEEFIKMIPQEGINEKEIAKSIKNQFTKEILKTSSTEFRKILKLGFGVNL
jgi:hypothetical protein